MEKIVTNLIIVLGFITVAFAGYYVFVQQSDSGLAPSSSEQSLQNMLNNTRVFISRRQALDTVQLESNVLLFDDARFRSLRSFSTPVQERPVGRPNPFEDAVVPSSNSSF